MSNTPQSPRRQDDLPQIKRRAKELLRDYRTGNEAALSLVGAHYRDADAGFALSDAQLVIARAEGFTSWSRLKAFVQARMQAKKNAVGAPYEAVALRSESQFRIGWIHPDGSGDPAGGCEGFAGVNTSAGATVDVPPSRVWFMEPQLDVSVAGWDEFLLEAQQRQAPGLYLRGVAHDAIMPRIAELKHLVYLDLSNCYDLSDTGLRHLSKLPHLEYLALNGYAVGDRLGSRRISDGGLAVLAELPNLRVVHLREMPSITDVAVSHLRNHKHLELVTMTGTACGDGALEALANKPTLTHLATGNNVTDEGLVWLTRYPGLRNWDDNTASHMIDEYRGPFRGYLRVTGDISDHGAAHLANLDGVEAVALQSSSPALTGTGALHVTTMRNLRQFDLPGQLITDVFLGGVANMTQIKRMSLGRTATSDDGLRALARSKSIRHVDLNNHTGFSAQGLAGLAAMPHLESLDIGSEQCRDEWLACLSDFPTLRRISTGGRNVFTNEAFRHIATAPALEHVTNMYCRDGSDGHRTDDRFVRYLSASTTIKSIAIWGSFVTDEACRILAKMQQLEELRFQNCPRVTDDGICELARLPKLRVLHLDCQHQITAAAASAFDRSVQVNL